MDIDKSSKDSIIIETNKIGDFMGLIKYFREKREWEREEIYNSRPLLSIVKELDREINKCPFPHDFEKSLIRRKRPRLLEANIYPH